MLDQFELSTYLIAFSSMHMRRMCQLARFEIPITSTQFLQSANQHFLAMKILNAASALRFVGTLQCWFIARNVLALELVGIFRLMRLLLRFTKLVLTTSSAVKIILAAEIRFSSKDMPAQVCMHVHSLKVA